MFWRGEIGELHGFVGGRRHDDAAMSAERLAGRALGGHAGRDLPRDPRGQGAARSDEHGPRVRVVLRLCDQVSGDPARGPAGGRR